MSQLADDLARSIEILETEGWRRDAYHGVRDGKQCHCSLGAIGKATGHHLLPDEIREDHLSSDGSFWGFDFDPAQMERATAAVRAVEAEIDGVYLGGFNDNVAESVDEVLAVFRRALEKAQAAA